VFTFCLRPGCSVIRGFSATVSNGTTRAFLVGPLPLGSVWDGFSLGYSGANAFLMDYGLFRGRLGTAPTVADFESQSVDLMGQAVSLTPTTFAQPLWIPCGVTVADEVAFAAVLVNNTGIGNVSVAVLFGVRLPPFDR